MGWTPKVTQNPARWGLCQRNLPAALAPAGQAGTHLPRCPSAYTLELGGPSREGLGGGGLCDPWLLTPGPIFPRSPLPPWAGLIFLHLDLPYSLWMGLCPSACTPTFPQTFLKHTWDHTPPFHTQTPSMAPHCLGTKPKSPAQAPGLCPSSFCPEVALPWKEKVKPAALGRLVFWGLHQELTEVASSGGP